ncbi:aminoglycoside phosphotransferase family protein [Roseiconus nitratireducens]|nr:aminoglycoside phosphotransferase family protein [Roseiconus nitratireducens]
MIPEEIRSGLLQHHGLTQVHPLAAGMSGAELYGCQGPRRLVLRRWPSGTKLDRVALVHRVISQAQKHCPLLPEYQRGRAGETVVVDARGGLWELVDWMPGEPLSYAATRNQVAAGAGAIAAVHRALRIQGQSEQPVAAVRDRQVRIGALDAALPRAVATDPPRQLPSELADTVVRAAAWLRTHWAMVSTSHSRRLEAVGRQPRLAHYVLRDVHREHVLFRQGQPSGIIDFDALRVDSPATDLARWTGSFAAYWQDPDGTIEAVVAGYGDQEPLFNRQPQAELRTLLRALIDSAGWISLANWVVWLVVEGRQFPDWGRVDERLKRLLEQIRCTL